jgi:hypothetical protein
MGIKMMLIVNYCDRGQNKTLPILRNFSFSMIAVTIVAVHPVHSLILTILNQTIKTPHK